MSMASCLDADADVVSVSASVRRKANPWAPKYQEALNGLEFDQIQIEGRGVLGQCPTAGGEQQAGGTLQPLLLGNRRITGGELLIEQSPGARSFSSLMPEQPGKTASAISFGIAADVHKNLKADIIGEGDYGHAGHTNAAY